MAKDTLVSEFEKKVVRFTEKNAFDVWWQNMKFGFKRAVIPCDCPVMYRAVIALTEKMKNVSVETWACYVEPFEGYVYLMDAADKAELDRLSKEEQARVEDWWQRYHVADEETKRLMACGKLA